MCPSYGSNGIRAPPIKEARYPPFLGLGLGDVLHLLLHRGEQMELGEVGAFRLRFHIVRRHGNGGPFARRLLLILIYL